VTTTTIELPNGVKVRSQSARRYLVVWTWKGKATIHKRSDNLQTARAEDGKHRDRQDDDGRWMHWFLVDTVEGKAIELRDKWVK
jgi:hypothetical protein